MASVIVPGTIACIRERGKSLCAQRRPHRHKLEPIYGPMPRMREEPTFAGIVAGLCDFYGLQYCHVSDARKALISPGWPDFEIWGPGTGKLRRKYVELKGWHGILSNEQRRAGNKLLEAGEDWAMWRTVDLYSGDIEAALLRMAEPPP